jgi:hypothetical protein
MSGLAARLSMLLVLASVTIFITAFQQKPDEIEALRHAASVIRMLTEYEGPVDDYPPAIRERLDVIISALRNDEIDRAEEMFSSFLDGYTASGSTPEARAEELNGLFNTVVREACSRDVADLRYVADKVRYYDDAIRIAHRYIAELEKYKTEAGDGEVTITTTELKRSYAYAESPEAMGSIRRLSAVGIDAEIERVKRQIADMEKQVESAVMQLQFAARRKMRVVNRVVDIHDRFHAVLERRLESVGVKEEQP